MNATERVWLLTNINLLPSSSPNEVRGRRNGDVIIKRKNECSEVDCNYFFIRLLNLGNVIFLCYLCIFYAIYMLVLVRKLIKMKKKNTFSPREHSLY